MVKVASPGPGVTAVGDGPVVAGSARAGGCSHSEVPPFRKEGISRNQSAPRVQILLHGGTGGPGVINK